MEESIKDIGRTENNMEKENSSILKKIFGKKEFGMKVREFNGKILHNQILLEQVCQIIIKFNVFLKKSLLMIYFKLTN